ncbi:MAG: L-2-amino-thiazoline-4-carboxylic acid hydrolase [Synergistales bacterium]|jgi:hypothetical protein|nr:L-2-amino-thiazoline-4-carboxylic acid hydrolase [Synergistales bacterium]MDD5760418.1 L-2-amino-thiazoline-4-carboxylic acid hydrolase [Desulfobulbaceae bacterium]
MMTIRNEATIKDQHVEDMRNAIEHRATWFYFLLDEARKRGLDWDDFARAAIFRTGCFHGDVKFTKIEDLKQFAREFANDLVRQIFEMDVVESTDDRFVVEFHFCPLVRAWTKLTDNEEEIAHLCDIAMDGDRGIVSRFPDFRMELKDTIASGGKVCRLVITRKKNS